MWQATRKAAELIKLVTYCNNVNAYCDNHAHTLKYRNPSHIGTVMKTVTITELE